MTSSPPETPDSEPDQPSRLKSVAPHWVAIVAIAALAAIAVIWLWSELQNNTAGRDAIAARVAALSTRIDDLAKIPTFADPATVDKLVVDVGDLTKRTSENARGVKAIGERVDVAASTTQARSKSQSDRVEALESRVGSVESAMGNRADALAASLQDLRAQADATRAALAGLTAKQGQDAKAAATQLASLTAQAGDLDRRLARLEAWAERARPARVAEQLVALADLRRMVESGSPFAGPLQRVQASLPAAKDPGATAGWAAYADTGLPTAAGLGRQLAAIARGRPHAGPVETGSTWVDSAVGTLLKGVTIDDSGPLGQDPVADAFRAAHKALAAGDLAAADAAVAPIAERMPAVVEWRKALTARQQALAMIGAWDKTVMAGISEAPK
ncbi:MAG: hypothetical protein KDC18_09715 [Alphaproteobacteria bacterium]|nr:hypothetical protein [Alphaproteobacteria bacterium]